MDLDYKKWCRRDRWKVYEAARLIAGLNPVEPSFDKYTVRGIVQNKYRSEMAIYTDIIENAEISIRAGTLKHDGFSPSSASYNTTHVKPREFLIWANNKEFDIPDYLRTEFDIPHPDISSNEDTGEKIGKPEKRIRILEGVISEMLENGVIAGNDTRWPRTKIWKQAVKTDPELFPDNPDDQREGVFGKAYDIVKKTWP